MTTATLPAAAAAAAEPEFVLSAQEFDRVRDLIHDRAGIHLHSGKQAMVYSRLSRRLRATGQRSFSDYLLGLELGGDPAEWQEFVNCLTTNLTAFFREQHHFQALADDLRARAGQPLRLWCNAASTGEEPYSLAMTVIESLGTAAPVQIVCSDIDTQVLATAQKGVYRADSRGLTPEHLQRHFLRGTGANEGAIRVRPALQRLIRFQPFNLAGTQWESLGEPFDIVFCRNVMIYFNARTQAQVLARLHAVMKPGALLFVGHSENFNDSNSLFRLRGQTVYERV